jgi:hypothetical protein
MKAISVIQPWPWLMIHAGKDVENRRWQTSYRGPIAIHASARRSWEEWAYAYSHVTNCKIHVELPEIEIGERRTGRGSITWTLKRWPEELVIGAVVAIADLVDCVTVSDSPWFFGPYGFVLANVRPLARPIPAKGALQLWEWDAPKGVLAA